MWLVIFIMPLNTRDFSSTHRSISVNGDSNSWNPMLYNLKQEMALESREATEDVERVEINGHSNSNKYLSIFTNFPQ